MDTDRPCVDVNCDGQYSLIYSDRGQVTKSELALDIDHLLYLIFSDRTYFMAQNTTYENSNKEIDVRRLQFEKQPGLPGKLNNDWYHAEKEK